MLFFCVQDSGVLNTSLMFIQDPGAFLLFLFLPIGRQKLSCSSNQWGARNPHAREWKIRSMPCINFAELIAIFPHCVLTEFTLCFRLNESVFFFTLFTPDHLSAHRVNITDACLLTKMDWWSFLICTQHLYDPPGSVSLFMSHSVYAVLHYQLGFFTIDTVYRFWSSRRWLPRKKYEFNSSLHNYHNAHLYMWA